MKYLEYLLKFKVQEILNNLKKLCKIIEEKLENALVITLIVDIWTNKIGADYIAVAASTLDSCWVHEVYSWNDAYARTSQCRKYQNRY